MNQVITYPCRVLIGVVVTLALMCPLVGCGSPLAQVTGKVLANGQPVTEGTLTFAPVSEGTAKPGSPSIGQIKSDGTFVLGTNKESDGAVVGQHMVLYAAPSPEGPEWDGYGAEPAMKVSPFAHYVAKEPQVEVKAGKNELTIELVPGPPPPQPEDESSSF